MARNVRGHGMHGRHGDTATHPTQVLLSRCTLDSTHSPPFLLAAGPSLRPAAAPAPWESNVFVALHRRWMLGMYMALANTPSPLAVRPSST